MGGTVGPERLSAVVLVGAYEWGKSAFDRLMPRPLLPVAQTPVICYVIDWLAQSGVRTATVCYNDKTSGVRALLGDGSRYSLCLDYVHDATPRGPAGCVRDAGERTSAETLLVIDGTTLPSVQLQDVLETHATSGAALTVVAHQAGFAQSRPWDPLLPGGIYLLDRRVCGFVLPRGYQDIKEGLIPCLHRAGERIVTHLAPGMTPQILNAGTYLSVNHWMIERLLERRDAPTGRPGRSEVMAHATARIAGNARIVGPVLVGPSASVGSAATIVGPAAIGAGCSVDPGAVVSRSVTWSRCRVGCGALVDNSILADDAVVLEGQSVFGTLMASGVPSRRLTDLRPAPSTSPGEAAAGRALPSISGELAGSRLLHQYAPVSYRRAAVSDVIDGSMLTSELSGAAGGAR